MQYVMLTVWSLWHSDPNLFLEVLPCNTCVVVRLNLSIHSCNKRWQTLGFFSFFCGFKKLATEKPLHAGK